MTTPTIERVDDKVKQLEARIRDLLKKGHAEALETVKKEFGLSLKKYPRKLSTLFALEGKDDETGFHISILFQLEGIPNGTDGGFFVMPAANLNTVLVKPGTKEEDWVSAWNIVMGDVMQQAPPKAVALTKRIVDRLIELGVKDLSDAEDELSKLTWEDDDE